MMKTLLTTLALLFTLTSFAQTPIWSYAVGNWRSGPVVYLSPVIETTGASTAPQLIDRLKQEHEELNDITDIDVLFFATIEEANENRATLRAKYLQRPLEVRMLEGTIPIAPSIEEK